MTIKNSGAVQKVESPQQGDSRLGTILRYVLISIVDALALILVYGLAYNGNYGLAAVLGFATVLVNIISFVPSLYPLRWMAPGIFLVIVLVIYPIFYTVYMSFTNFGEGRDGIAHRLTKDQAIELIINRRQSLFISDDATVYRWYPLLSQDDASEYGMLLLRTDESDELVEAALAPIDAPIIELSVDEIVEQGITDTPRRLPETFSIGGYDSVPLSGLGAALPVIENSIFGEGEDTAAFRTSQEAVRPLATRFEYNAEMDALIDVADNIVYRADNGSGAFRPEPITYTYDADADVLSRTDTDAVITPNSDGLFELPGGLTVRYVSARNALIGTPTGGTFTTNDAGEYEIAAGEVLNPGYRVFVGVFNYTRFFSDPSLRGPLVTVFIWTVMFAFLSVFTTFSVGLFVAIILNDASIPGKKIIRSLLIIPYAIPGIIGIVVWRGMLLPELGVVWTMIVDFFGVSVNWQSNAVWARFVIILVNLWLGYPYMMLICSGALQSISSDVYEAAAVDGATKSDSFWRITLPLLLVTVGPLLIASFVFNFNNYLMIEAMTEGGPPIPGTSTPAGYTDILISYTYRLAFGSGERSDFGYASAITIIIFFLVAAVTMVQYRFTKTWEEVGENV